MRRLGWKRKALLKSKTLSWKTLSWIVLLDVAGGAWASPAHTNPLNFDPLVKQAYARFYLLDFPGAVEPLERFHAEHPGDPQPAALLLDALLFQELYRLDLLDTTFYANDGFLSGKHATQEDPKMRDRILGLADETVREADWRIGKNPNDIDALYARGWARALKCTYIAMVERGFGAGFRLATKAREDEMRVLQLDPDYVDAKLITGVYEYVVGALPLPFKFFIGFAGITGSKSKGMEMLHDAANRGVMSSAEAGTVIALFLRREAKYKEAIGIVNTLNTRYPHNYLFRLEEANLRKDDGEGMGAVNAYREIVAYEQAASALNVGLELKIRSLVAAGQCRDMNNERQLAIKDYQAAIDAGPNTSRADTARKYLKSPYHGS
jgi:tetratricopeptide (TPR) repeat protein